MPNNDPHGLARFVEAQDRVYPAVVSELSSGFKQSHWMWFIFPQVEGLGVSPTSKFYSIKNAEDARQYLAHPILGPRLVECSSILLALQGRSAQEIFGSPDDMKLRSCMTLFESVAGSEKTFGAVLDKYFDGKRDQRTLELLQQLGA